MSLAFQDTIRGLHEGLKSLYNASSCVLIPGGGTFGMEAVARQFAKNQKVVVLRNGWFSFRWTQIFDHGVTPAHVEVAKAQADSLKGLWGGPAKNSNFFHFRVMYLEVTLVRVPNFWDLTPPPPLRGSLP